ncbi:MAG TPA: DUF2231 domain-containing protein [Sphingomicrobium sp.]|nr:DUF2231 domain-containing protein [Sphingomicrobium sp.]
MGSLRFLLCVLALLMLAASPANAHEEHKRKRAEAALALKAAQAAQAAGKAAQATDKAAPIPSDPAVMHSQMGEMMETPTKPRSSMTLVERMLDWLGRTHAVIVHFPIAFFPAALFTAVVGRRRPAFAKPVQFLVLAGGIIAPVAALFGWFNAGFAFAADDALLAPHRWLGTAVGIAGAALALWAWRRPEDDRGPGMIIGLTIITTAIVVQGWFGGALVHGMDHMRW